MTQSPTASPPTDISAPLLNLLAPGLGQLYQRRTREGIHFLVNSVILTWAFFAAPSLRISAWICLLAIAAWSILDAMRAERLARA
ncbi:MAG TPA: hypothetical protein VFK36_13235 [Gemmatimonadales bacterium]|nr:hypothetical protein [Gemmatimonadales bacterium]